MKAAPHGAAFFRTSLKRNNSFGIWMRIFIFAQLNDILLFRLWKGLFLLLIN